MSLVVHGFPFSPPTQLAVLTCYEKELQFEFKLVNMFKGENRSPAYMALNPFGKVPSLQDGSFTLYESRAIAKYLDGKFSTGTRLVPNDLVAKSRMEQWIGVDTGTIQQATWPIIEERMLRPMQGGKSDEDRIRAAVKVCETQFDILNTQLSTNTYLAGEQFTLADLGFIPLMSLFPQLPEASLLTSRPHLMRWWKLISARPSFVKLGQWIGENKGLLPA